MLDIFDKKWKSKLKILFENRKIMSKDDFLKKMSLKGYDISSSKIVYERIFVYLPNSLDKNIYPKDNVLKDYDIDDEDLGDILIKCFNSLKIEFPSTIKQNNFYKKYGDDITIERLIQFIDFFKKDGNGNNISIE